MFRSAAKNQATIAALCSLLLLCACDVETFDDAVSTIDTPSTGTPPPTDPPPDPAPDPTPDPPPGGLTPVFSDIQTNVFTPNCASSSCHAGANPAAQLSLDAVASYADLVGIESSQQAGTLRVEAGNADNSYLIQKMEGSAAIGNVMPPSGGLPQSTIDVVRQWITDGATDDRVAVAAPVQLRSLDPMPGAVVTARPRNIIAGFDRELNAASVDASTFVLESTGGDGSFDDGAVTVTATSVRVLPGNPTTAVLDLSGVALPDDTYRVRFVGDTGLLIEDLDGNALDGDGDGVPGGGVEAEFTLSTSGNPASGND